MALSFNKPDPTTMNKKPWNNNEKLVSNWTLIRYLIIGIYIGFATVGIYFINLHNMEYSTKNS